MNIGNLKQKASPYLSLFVMGCIVVTVGLLFVLQKTEAVRDSLPTGAFIPFLN